MVDTDTLTSKKCHEWADFPMAADAWWPEKNVNIAPADCQDVVTGGCPCPHPEDEIHHCCQHPETSPEEMSPACISRYGKVIL